MGFKLPHGSRRSSDLVYQNKHHGDTVFRNSFFEELHMFNDDCDGLVWKKEHTKDCVLCQTSWYPGFYASTSYMAGMVHPDDFEDKNGKKYSYVPNGNFIGGQAFTRTKDFIISSTLLYYYKYYIDYRISNDGVHWRKWINNIPNSSWGGIGSWSTKENLGLIHGSNVEGKTALWRMEIDEKGDLSFEEITGAEAPSFFLGDIAGQGIQQDGIHQWYKFVDVHGNKYVSVLPNTYTYTDDRESDPTKKVKTATYQWSFKYLNSKYYAATMKGGSVYWNPVKQEWQQLRTFMVVESSDGFRHITTHIVMDPCPYINYQSWDYMYFNGRIIIQEWGKEHETDTQQYFKIRDLNNNVLGSVIEKVRMPFVGMSTDGAYDVLDFYFRNSQPESNRVCVRGYGGGISAVYIKDGKPTEPYGSILVPTAFRKNGWSSNSYDIGGFIFLKCGEKDPFFTKQPSEAFAFCADNSMIDRDNATWGEDYYKITIKGGSGTMQLSEERTHYTNSYTVEKSSEDWVKHCYFHIDQIARLTYGNKIVRRRLRRGGQTFFELRDPEYNVACGYYMEGTGVYSTVFGREFSKVNSGPAYVFIIGYLSRGYQYIAPLVISTDEFNVVYDPGGPVTNSKIIDYGGFKWYYNGFSYGFGGDDPTVPYYLNLHSLGGSATEQEMVLECLKTVHPVN